MNTRRKSAEPTPSWPKPLSPVWRAGWRTGRLLVTYPAVHHAHRKVKAVLNDIGTEELPTWRCGHLVYNLIKDASIEQIKAAGMEGYYADHDKALYFVNGDGVPWVAAYIQSKGDPITDLHENMAAEQKARSTYEYLINLSDDPGVTETLRWLRAREIVHYQRFGETLQHLYDYYNSKRVFY